MNKKEKNTFTICKDKKVLIRVECNVPLTKSGKIADNERIQLITPTIKRIIASKPKQIILMTHLGRPKIGDAVHNKYLKTDVLAKELEKLLKRRVVKVNHQGEETIPETAKIVFLENLRFDPGEKSGDKTFAKQLASLADIYVNESFGTSHRKDASMYAVPSLFSSTNRLAGDLLKKEVTILSEVVTSKDLTVIVGFAKIADKIKVLEKLLQKSTKVFIGGKVVFAFLKAQGLNIGKVEVSQEDVDTAKRLLQKYGKKISMPVDFRGLQENNSKVCSFDSDNLPFNFVGLDIGPKTVLLWKQELLKSSLVFWNGPLGYFEKKPFDKATNEITEFLASNNKKIKTIVGGGDTVSAIKKSGFSNKLYHLSSGGGASLEFIEKNGKLPALKWF